MFRDPKFRESMSLSRMGRAVAVTCRCGELISYTIRSSMEHQASMHNDPVQDWVWVCPVCFELLGSRKMPQPVALDRLRIHAGRSGCVYSVDGPTAGADSHANPPAAAPDKHTNRPPMATCQVCKADVRSDRLARHVRDKHPAPRLADASLENTPSLQPADRLDASKDNSGASHATSQLAPPKPGLPPFAECKRCGRQVKQGLMDVHLEQYCPTRPGAVDVSAAAGLHVTHLPFELLPAGSWDVQHVIDYYDRRDTRTWLRGREVDIQRIYALRSLTPIRCYVGSKMWLGYILFEFAWSTSAVLECPLTGNATYVLAGNWRARLGETKQRLRTVFSSETTKVVHKGEWLQRVRQALRTHPSPGSAGRSFR
jgi:hypothetical protein